jgi:hypothetical protein
MLLARDYLSTGVKLANSNLVGFHGTQSRSTYYVALVLLCDYIG